MLSLFLLKNPGISNINFSMHEHVDCTPTGASKTLCKNIYVVFWFQLGFVLSSGAFSMRVLAFFFGLGPQLPAALMVEPLWQHSSHQGRRNMQLWQRLLCPETLKTSLSFLSSGFWIPCSFSPCEHLPFFKRFPLLVQRF